MTSDTRAISKSFNSSTSSTSTVKLKTPPGDLTARLGLELSDTKQIPSRSPSPLPSAAKRNIFDTENKVRLLLSAQFGHYITCLEHTTNSSMVSSITQVTWSRQLSIVKFYRIPARIHQGHAASKRYRRCQLCLKNMRYFTITSGALRNYEKSNLLVF